MSAEDDRQPAYLELLDPDALAKIHRLELIARGVVEGFVAGRHQSPYKGFSVEFAEHREYVPGDNIRDLDWRVLARSDRYYIKQYVEETNLRGVILLDASGSMGYAGQRAARHNGRPLSKFRYGQFLAASLAHLMIHQQDAAGLVTFDTAIRRYIPPRSRVTHLKVLLEELAATAPGNETSVAAIFHDVAERIRRRGLVVIISDLFVDPKELALGLQHFRHKRHEVIVFHVLDRYERAFPFMDLTLFKGMEGYQDVFAEPRGLRDDYLAELEAFIRDVRRVCRQHRIDYVPMTTSDSLGVALSAYLAGRLAMRGK